MSRAPSGTAWPSMRPISAAIASASGTPRVRMPTSMRSETPRLRSLISPAIRRMIRAICSASRIVFFGVTSLPIGSPGPRHATPKSSRVTILAKARRFAPLVLYDGRGGGRRVCRSPLRHRPPRRLRSADSSSRRSAKGLRHALRPLGNAGRLSRGLAPRSDRFPPPALKPVSAPGDCGVWGRSGALSDRVPLLCRSVLSRLRHVASW